jgi:hypothetical protein
MATQTNVENAHQKLNHQFEDKLVAKSSELTTNDEALVVRKTMVKELERKKHN